MLWHKTNPLRLTWYSPAGSDTTFILAERRPYRECRKKTVPSYKDVSSDSENDFHDVDSSFNQTLEDNSIEGAKRAFKDRAVEAEVVRVTEALDKLSSLEDTSEVIEEGIIVQTVDTHNLEAQNHIDMAGDKIVNFEDEDGVDEAGAMREACSNLAKLEYDPNDLKFFFKQAEIRLKTSILV